MSMKMVFLVYDEFLGTRVMELLRAEDIDYYTQWRDVHGKAGAPSPTSAKADMPASTRC